MEQWKSFSSNMGPMAQKLSRGFGNLNQQARERFGAIDADDITELPQEYKDLERRVDALRVAHQNLLKIARVYETEPYDYPTLVQESVSQLSASIGHSVTSWAASATKGTNLPTVHPTSAPPEQHKTLSHAISRAAASGALELGASPTNIAGLPNSPSSGASTLGKERAAEGESKLGEALQKFALAQDRVGNARLTQDDTICEGFLAPWNAFGTNIQLAIKARQSVREARLHLDSWKQTLKGFENSGKTEKLDSTRAEVEQAEDKLVAATEEAIGLMKSVLDDPEPIKSLNEFVKAQAAFHSAAAELLTQLQAEISQTALSVESDYRKSRD